jgi:hypothetical protein
LPFNDPEKIGFNVGWSKIWKTYKASKAKIRKYKKILIFPKMKMIATVKI